jgi:hypothetical protein
VPSIFDSRELALVDLFNSILGKYGFGFLLIFSPDFELVCFIDWCILSVIHKSVNETNQKSTTSIHLKNAISTKDFFSYFAKMKYLNLEFGAIIRCFWWVFEWFIPSKRIVFHLKTYFNHQKKKNALFYIQAEQKTPVILNFDLLNSPYSLY